MVSDVREEIAEISSGVFDKYKNGEGFGYYEVADAILERFEVLPNPKQPHVDDYIFEVPKRRVIRLLLNVEYDYDDIAENLLRLDINEDINLESPIQVHAIRQTFLQDLLQMIEGNTFDSSTIGVEITGDDDEEEPEPEVVAIE